MAQPSKKDELSVYLYIPNIIGYIRVIINCGGFALCYTNKPLFAFLYFFSFVCDGLDGYLARKFNQVSTFGAVLDMVTDRVSTACLLALLSQFYSPGLIFLALLGLDIASHWLQMYRQYVSSILLSDQLSGNPSTRYANTPVTKIVLKVELVIFCSFLSGKTSHKDVRDKSNWLLKAYYGYRPFMAFCCVACEVLYIILFLYADKESPKLSHVSMNIIAERSLVSLVFVLTLFGWAIKQVINVIQMKSAADSCVLYDTKRTK